MTSHCDQIRLVLEKHVHSLRKDGTEIFKALQDPAPTRDGIYAMTHKFKGGSGTAGFQDVYKVSLALHRHVAQSTDDILAVDATMLSLAEELQALLADLRPEASALLAK